MKRTFLIVLLIFSLSFFTGCSNESNKSSSLSLDDFIMLSLSFNIDGSICQSLDFSVNSENLKEIASDEEIFAFKNSLIEEIKNIRNEFLFGYALKYIKNPIEEFKINQGLVLTEVLYNTKTDTIGFDILFTSINSWNYYHDQSSSSSEGNENNNFLFYKKIISTGKFVFSTPVKVNEEETILIGKRYQQKYIEASKGLSFEAYIKENYKPTFAYNYATPTNRLHSDSQYEYLDSNNLFHHIWTVGYDELNENNTISLYYVSINYGWWYFFAILISLLVMTLILVVNKIKSKRNN